MIKTIIYGLLFAIIYIIFILVVGEIIYQDWKTHSLLRNQIIKDN